MRTVVTDSSVSLWLSARDTYEWAHRTGAAWPCSQLSGRRVFAQFDRNGLCDLSVDGGRGDQDVDGHEFNACTSDFLRTKVHPEHPCHAVCVTLTPHLG